MKKVLLCMIILSSVNYSLGNEQESLNYNLQRTKFWFNYNAGAVTNIERSKLALGGGLVFSRIRKNSVQTIRYLGGLEFTYESALPPTSVKDLGFLFGQYLTFKNLVFCFSGGISYVYIIERGKWLGGGDMSYKHETLTYHTIGMPGEIQIFRKNGKTGLGLSLFANLNPHRSIFGVLLFWQVRKF